MSLAGWDVKPEDPEERDPDVNYYQPGGTSYEAQDDEEDLPNLSEKIGTDVDFTDTVNIQPETSNLHDETSEDEDEEDFSEEIERNLSRKFERAELDINELCRVVANLSRFLAYEEGEGRSYKMVMVGPGGIEPVMLSDGDHLYVHEHFEGLEGEFNPLEILEQTAPREEYLELIHDLADPDAENAEYKDLSYLDFSDLEECLHTTDEERKDLSATFYAAPGLGNKYEEMISDE